jgi:hypothetical protein
MPVTHRRQRAESLSIKGRSLDQQSSHTDCLAAGDAACIPTGGQLQSVHRLVEGARRLLTQRIQEGARIEQIGQVQRA